MLNINDKIGLLTIKYIKNINNKNYAICQCDCGKSCNKRIDIIHKLKNANCGCMPFWKSNCVGLISKTFFYRIKYDAKRRHLEFKLTIEYIWSLYEKQNKNCALTGVPITFGIKGAHERGSASLDRIDSSIGYIEGNVQWVHKDINRMKLDLNEKEFIKYCKLIAINN